MKTAAELRQLVTRIDHRSYPAYKDTKECISFRAICYLLTMYRRSVCISIQGQYSGERKDCRISGAVISDKMAENSIEDALIRQFDSVVRNLDSRQRDPGRAG